MRMVSAAASIAYGEYSLRIGTPVMVRCAATHTYYAYCAHRHRHARDDALGDAGDGVGARLVRVRTRVRVGVRIRVGVRVRVRFRVRVTLRVRVGARVRMASVRACTAAS